MPKITDRKKRIQKLNRFIRLIDAWEANDDPTARREINKLKREVHREVVEAGCMKRLTISPPPAIGGLVMQNIDPFEIIFDCPYFRSFNDVVRDMIQETIGVLENTSDTEKPTRESRKAQVSYQVEKGYVFVAMPIGPPEAFDDVLDSIKEACQKCGLTAERVDEAESNERITDRILESIQKAEYVVVDLTESRPNVFFEAGYAQGIGKLPIYIAKHGTSLEFDLQDYPVIFFQTHRELKGGLEKRLRSLAEQR